jgi:hypothetical protein
MVGGAEAEFEAFAAREGKRLLGFALLLTGDWQDAEDLVQLALLRSASLCVPRISSMAVTSRVGFPAAQP